MASIFDRRAFVTHFFLSVAAAVLATVTAATSKAPLRACVVGGGIAGASTAHFLSQLRGVSVTVFERHADFGGRIGTVPLGDGKTIEAGASIIASRNKLMRHFVTLLGLSPRKAGEESETFGLWDGMRFRLRTPSSKIATLAKMVLRYRLSLLRTREFVAALLDRFDALYPSAGIAGRWRAGADVETLFAPTNGLYNLSQTSFAGVVEGILSERFVEEMASAITRINYNSEVAEMNGIAGAIALAGSGDDLWAVKGGNVQVVRELMRRSGAETFLRTEIVRVAAAEMEKGYVVGSRDGREWGCEVVVLTMPLELAEIALPQSMAARADVGREFRRTVATFVRGTLNEGTFGAQVPDAVLTTANSEGLFSSVSRVFQFENGSSVYKVFSKEKLSVDDLGRIFSAGAEVIAVYPWFAYPKFNIPERFAPFELDPGGAVYYTSPIESMGSAMEMSAISGANVAALIRDKFRLEVKDNAQSGKDEL